MPKVSPGAYLLGGVFLAIVGYALFYTGVSQVSHGGFTQGNVQGLATSLGLDKLTAKAPAWQGGGGGSLDAPAAPGTPTPINGGTGTVAA